MGAQINCLICEANRMWNTCLPYYSLLSLLTLGESISKITQSTPTKPGQQMYEQLQVLHGPKYLARSQIEILSKLQ